MGKGKKKGQKGGDGGDKGSEVPSVASLSLSEDAPSTSQAVEEEEDGLGLGVGSRKKNRKQKQAEAKAAATAVAKEPIPPQEKPAEETKVEPPPEPKPEGKKEDPKVEESEGLGLGLGGGGRKRPKKKKSSVATDQETKPQGSAPSGSLPPVQEYPVQPGPQPLQPAPQTGWGLPGHPSGLTQGPPHGIPQHGMVQQGMTQQAMPQQSMPQHDIPPYAMPPSSMPQPGMPQHAMPQPGMPQHAMPQPRMPQHGIGRGTPTGPVQPGFGRGAAPPGMAPPRGQAPWQSQPPFSQSEHRPSPASASLQSPPTPASQAPQAMQQPVQSSRASTPASTSSQEMMRVTPSRGDLSCRYKIPIKVLGRSVRHIPTKVITNYLPMVFKAIKVFRYDVIIKPDKPKKMLPTAFKMAIKKQFPKDSYIAFDQVKNCYTLVPLKDVSVNSRLSIPIDVDDPNGRSIRFEVSFKATGFVDLAKLQHHMDTGGSSLNTPAEEIQCVDVILRQGALESYVKCGRQFFKRPNNPVDLTGGLEMWTGLFQSAIFTTRGFINIDVVHKGFPLHQSMIDAITKSFKLSADCKIEDQRKREKEDFLAFIKGLRVTARLVGPPHNGQTRDFICNGIVDTPSRLSFTCEKDGKKFSMTVAEYFAKEKGYRIQYPNLNCMWVGPRDKNIYYPMELLQVSYGQARNRQLNEFQLSNMVRLAAAPPHERKRKIEEVAACMNYSGNAFFKKFGLEISNKFLEVEAKILAPPDLDCGERNIIQPRKGQWQSNRLVKPEALASWGFIAIDCDPRGCNYDVIRDLLLNTGRQLGMEVAEPKLRQFNVRLNELRNLLFSALEKGVRFLFIIVGSRGRDTYHRVKQMAERDVGILTQCIKENTAARRMNGATIKNILLKVNSKLMGVNQVLDARAMPNCLKGGDVMIVGADVTHPSPDQTNIPSIAAVTASMDSKCFIYNIELSIQTPKKEMIVEFAEMMFDHLKLWREKNRKLPRKIYVFRDGVSEGQFAEVMNSELAAVHTAYQRFGAPKPEVLFLLVQKRHHTRFFTSPRCDNVEPGTVVDTHIVHPKELDFYLVSHQAIKGTARPTRYHAICNDGNIPHDEVEQLTYYLCHLYSRCMRSVSYPTPTYYAHLACFRARSLTYGQTFDNAALETKPERLRVLDKMLQFSRMFFV